MSRPGSPTPSITPATRECTGLMLTTTSGGEAAIDEPAAIAPAHKAAMREKIERYFIG
ncbi:MAG: hypothetical protein ISN28_04960 [Ectothiorhodospiraceae bacterium AqS1]|nr:hypothetical protein [Ectothiorhodospiraceae bacterium AqS1]